jgi:hypothetical protein
LSEISAPKIGADHLGRLQALLDQMHAQSDPSALPAAIMDAVVAIFSPDIACYYAKDRRRKDFYRAASHPDGFWRAEAVKKAFERRPITGGAIGSAIQSRRMVVIGDPDRASQERRYLPFSAEVGTEVVLPLLVQEAIVGPPTAVAVIVLNWYRERTISREVLALISLAGATISAALNSFLTRDRQEKHLTFLRAVLDVPRSDFDALYHRFLDALSKIAPTKFVTFWLYDSTNDILMARAFHPKTIAGKRIDFDSFDRTILSCSDSASGQVITARSPKVILLSETHDFANASFAKAHDLEWYVSLPLLSDASQIIGIVNVWPFGEPQEFDDDALRIYQESLVSGKVLCDNMQVHSHE